MMMRYGGLGAFLGQAAAVLRGGPVAVILAEDAVEVESALQHCIDARFAATLLLAPDEIDLPSALEAQIHRIRHDVFAEDPMVDAMNRLIAAAPGTWFHYAFNAEYLFFPFRESRNIRDLIAFHSEERRDAMLSHVIDLYAGDLTRHPAAVSREDAWLDRSGYYALARRDPLPPHAPKERQLDIFGGLRWRYEEHVSYQKRKIDRIALFRARPGLLLRPDFTFNDEEYNTFACPWHNNITTAICSFRTAKALRANPGSRDSIHCFRWRNSTPFDWHSQQLMDLGLMEPGQWF